MAIDSKIEWTDATWNPLRARAPDGRTGTHCEHVSEGCRNCYAETFNRRGLPGAGTGLGYKPGHRADLVHYLDDKMLLAPLRRRKPTRYFLSSLTDVFGAWVTDAMLDQLFAVMALCPHHTFQVLTKRPERARAYLRDFAIARSGFMTHGGRELVSFGGAETHTLNHDRWPLPNVWLGTSVEHQAAADERIPHLLATPAAVRFLSCEPLLGPLDLAQLQEGLPVNAWLTWLDGLHWIIAGGESGKGARPMHPDWPRSLRDQCAAAGVPFLFKQWGNYLPAGQSMADGKAWQPGCGSTLHATKKITGRLLDGVEHNSMPA